MAAATGTSPDPADRQPLLVHLLQQLAADPDAGPWREWARRFLAAAGAPSRRRPTPKPSHAPRGARR